MLHLVTQVSANKCCSVKVYVLSLNYVNLPLAFVVMLMATSAAGSVICLLIGQMDCHVLVVEVG